MSGSRPARSDGMPVEDRTVEGAGGVCLFVRLVGPADGDPLVLVHGLGADGSMWEPQFDRYGRAGFRLVVPDVRGHGRSAPVETFDLADPARDLRAVLDALDVERAPVVGVSMGGVVAQEFAIEHPARVSRLVLADTFSHVPGGLPRVNAWLGAVLLRVLPGRLLVAAVERFYDDPAVRAYFRRQFAETDPGVLRRARRAVNRFDRHDDLARIEAPTLVLAGADNPGWFLDLGREMAAAIPEARFESIPGARDPSNLTAAGAFDEAVLGFLA